MSRLEMEVTKEVHEEDGLDASRSVSSLCRYLLSVLLLRFRFKTRKWTSPRSPPSVGPKQISNTSLVSGPACGAETPRGRWTFRGHLSGLLTVTDFMTSKLLSQNLAVVAKTKNQPPPPEQTTARKQKSLSQSWREELKCFLHEDPTCDPRNAHKCPLGRVAELSFQCLEGWTVFPE